MKGYFASSDTRPAADIQSSINSLRMLIHSYHNSLVKLINTLIRASPVTRSAVLKYIAHIISLNSARSKIHVDMAEVSDDGFILNWAFVLLSLCEPFMDPQFKKVRKLNFSIKFMNRLIELMLIMQDGKRLF